MIGTFMPVTSKSFQSVSRQCFAVRGSMAVRRAEAALTEQFVIALRSQRTFKNTPTQPVHSCEVNYLFYTLAEACNSCTKTSITNLSSSIISGAVKPESFCKRTLRLNFTVLRTPSESLSHMGEGLGECLKNGSASFSF